MIIVLNCGSQSFKYKVFDSKLKTILEKSRKIEKQKDYPGVLDHELKSLNFFKDQTERICHRFVHGGENFRDPVVVTKRVLKKLKKCKDFAPLHNPYNILGIEKSFEVFPKVKQVAVFDTGFYKDLSKEVYTYPLPEKITKKYNFRKFGFHGISHEYVGRAGAKQIKKPFNKLKIISCHLGGGASITAVKNGKAIDTSMGFTPLEGLMMMTRIGDIDPGILIKLGKDLSVSEIDKILNKLSGVKGVSGLSDMKKVLKEFENGNKKAELALKIFIYRIKKYIGAYYALLNGCDLLIFTGAIGSGSSKIRKMIINGFEIIKKTEILFIETNEELLIAEKSKKL